MERAYSRSAKGRKVRYAALQRYRAKNRGRFAAYCAKHRALRVQRTPGWADLDAIQEFYQGCPQGHHVDHIVPISGKHVSGLHVLENLQYLPARENSRKANKHEQ
jgi:5-methylcytosine-specific restriction endonuclease McrA